MTTLTFPIFAEAFGRPLVAIDRLNSATNSIGFSGLTFNKQSTLMSLLDVEVMGESSFRVRGYE